MAWVILGHIFLQTLGAPTTNPSYREKVRLPLNLNWFHQGRINHKADEVK